MTLNIGFDAKRAFNNRTGLGNYSRFVLNALLNHSSQHQFLAYTPTIKKGLYDDFPNEYIVTSQTQNKLLAAYWRSFGIVNQLKKDNVHIYHGLSNELPSGLQKAGIKSVVTIHDLIFLRYPDLYPAIDRFFYRQKFKKACREADVIVAVSEQTKRDIMDFYSISTEKIKVVYQDCDVAFRLPYSTLPQKLVEKGLVKNNYLLCVGTIEARKNQLGLVQAFRQANLTEATLVLVGGKTKYQATIEAYIAQNQLHNRVRILNQVPFADLPALYQNARIFAYLSFFEGFGIPIVEALHSGVPVLAATGSCLEEAGGAGAIYANPNDINDIAQKLQQLWNDEILRQSLTVAGKKHVQGFDAAVIANQLTSIYTNL